MAKDTGVTGAGLRGPDRTAAWGTGLAVAAGRLRPRGDLAQGGLTCRVRLEQDRQVIGCVSGELLPLAVDVVG